MDPLSLVMGGASLLGNMFSSNSAAEQSKENTQATIQANAASAQKQMDFQERMSNTAYQRSSQDMQKAGLNPMMMFGGGAAASSPGGSAPTISVQNQSAGAGVGKAVDGAISSALAAKTNTATVDNLVATNANLKADLLKTKADTAVSEIEWNRRNQSYLTERENTRYKSAAATIAANEALTAKHESDMQPEVRKLLDQTGYAGKKTSDTIAPVSDIISSAAALKRMRPSRSTSETSHSDGSSSFNERFNY